MPDYAKFGALSPTAYADALGREQFMDIGIRELWPRIPRIAGPAYTVYCPPGNNLMLHAAIYRARPGAVIVVEAGDVDYALSGGNVCAIAQRRGIAGFIVDGVVRDLAEVRDCGFPIFARGVIPIPGKKQVLGTLNQTIRCGGVQVNSGDIVVADEEGIVVIPAAQQDSAFQIAKARTERDVAQSLKAWEVAHRDKIERLLMELGYSEQ